MSPVMSFDVHLILPFTANAVAYAEGWWQVSVSHGI